MVKRWGGAGVALALSLLKAQAPAPAPPCANTPAYSPCEMVFQLSDQESARHPNPYATVDLRAELRSPHQKTYPIPAYWDGGRRMVIRFTPTEAGDWDWHLTSNIAEWNDKQGSFTAAPSDAPGFLRVANVHHFAYLESKRAHLWMGASELLLMNLDDAQFRAVADARAAQKFNHLRFLVMAQGLGTAYSPDGTPEPAVLPEARSAHRVPERQRHHCRPDSDRRRRVPAPAISHRRRSPPPYSLPRWTLRRSEHHVAGSGLLRRLPRWRATS